MVVADDDSATAGAPSAERQGELKLRRPPIRTLSGERLRRIQRLRSSRDFQRVRAQGRRVSGAALTLGYVAQAEPGYVEYTRIGFSVSRRVGDAVTRNRVKRRLREVTRHMLTRIAPGYDLVITAKPGAADAPMEPLEQEVRTLLARARLLIAETDQIIHRDQRDADRGTGL